MEHVNWLKHTIMDGFIFCVIWGCFTVYKRGVANLGGKKVITLNTIFVNGINFFLNNQSKKQIFLAKSLKLFFLREVNFKKFSKLQ